MVDKLHINFLVLVKINSRIFQNLFTVSDKTNLVQKNINRITYFSFPY